MEGYDPEWCTPQVLVYLETSTHPIFMFMLFSQIAFCCIGAAMIYKTGGLESVLLPINMRILLMFQRFFMYLFFGTFVPIGLYHFLQRFVSSGCALLVPVRICVLFRIFQSWASVFFQILYIGVLFDIYGGLFSRTYRQSGVRGAKFTAMAMSVISFMSTAPSLPIDLQSDKMMVNCASLEHKSVASQRAIFIYFLFLDIISFVFFQVLLIFRRREMANPVFRFNANRTQIMRELMRTINVFYPILCFNILCYVFFASVSLYNTVQTENNDPIRFLFANSVPFYLCGTPFIWMYVTRHTSMKIGLMKPQQSSQEKHFRDLERLWNGDEEEERGYSERYQDSSFDNISVVTASG